MRKNRLSNLFGDILAIGTVSTVALSAKHVAKTYGQKYKGISINGLYLLDYAAGRIFGDGAKAQEKLLALLSKNKKDSENDLRQICD